jgi:hypothetical protein
MSSQPQSRIETALEISPLTVLVRGVLEGCNRPYSRDYAAFLGPLLLEPSRVRSSGSLFDCKYH